MSTFADWLIENHNPTPKQIQVAEAIDAQHPFGVQPDVDLLVTGRGWGKTWLFDRLREFQQSEPS